MNEPARVKLSRGLGAFLRPAVRAPRRSGSTRDDVAHSSVAGGVLRFGRIRLSGPELIVDALYAPHRLYCAHEPIDLVGVNVAGERDVPAIRVDFDAVSMGYDSAQ